MRFWLSGMKLFNANVMNFLSKPKKDKSKTVILVTHDMSAVQRYCNKAVYISDALPLKIQMFNM